MVEILIPVCTLIHKSTNGSPLLEWILQEKVHILFKERTVVSGGYRNDNRHNKLIIFESYNVIGDERSPMPNMINGLSTI